MWNLVRSDDLKVRPTECSGKNGERLCCLPARFFFEKKHCAKKQTNIVACCNSRGSAANVTKGRQHPGTVFGVLSDESGVHHPLHSSPVITVS